MTTPNSTLVEEQTNTQINKIAVVQTWLKTHLAEQLSLAVESIETTEQLTRYGLDSIDAVTLVGDLEDSLDLELPSTLFWDHPTIEQSSKYLVENYEFSESVLLEE